VPRRIRKPELAATVEATIVRVLLLLETGS